MNPFKRILEAIDSYIQSWHDAAERNRRTTAEIDAKLRDHFGLDSAAIEGPKDDGAVGSNGDGESHGRVKARKGGR